jgi:hypothetical protein
MAMATSDSSAPLGANKGGAETSAAQEQGGCQSGNTVAAGNPMIGLTAARPKTQQRLFHCRTTSHGEREARSHVSRGSREKAVPVLPNGTETTANSLRDYLFTTYSPGQVWTLFIVVGLISTVLMVVYDYFVRRNPAKST